MAESVRSFRSCVTIGASSDPSSLPVVLIERRRSGVERDAFVAAGLHRSQSQLLGQFLRSQILSKIEFCPLGLVDGVTEDRFGENPDL
mmetsp:Transcript_9447/g.28186  ORF Transcript_9447/g.28186 Transcript_9447/m.28186 type:complete len:88 (-) Transcript_9447:222-485(-)